MWSIGVADKKARFVAFETLIKCLKAKKYSFFAVSNIFITLILLCHVAYISRHRKYWRELNLAVGSQITIANILSDLNWRFGTGSPYIYMRVRNFGRFILAVA